LRPAPPDARPAAVAHRPGAARAVDGHVRRLRGGRRGGGDPRPRRLGAVRGARPAVIELTPHAEGTVVAVAAQPGARRTGVLGERNGALRLAVAAPPDKGKANDALADLL